MWVPVSPQGRSTGAPSRCCISILFNKEPACANDFCLKALPDHSFMCHFPECTTFTGPHDNRLVGTQRKERETLVRVDTSAPDPREMAQCTTHQLQDTQRPPLPSPPHPPCSQANGCQVSEGPCMLLSGAWPVVMWNPLEVASTQDGRSIDKAGGEVRQKQGKEKKLFYLPTVLYSP